MRQRILAGLLLTVALQTGCVVPMYSASPPVRARQLIYVSESMRQIHDIWERIWSLDMPDLATPYRTHGGVI